MTATTRTCAGARTALALVGLLATPATFREGAAHPLLDDCRALAAEARSAEQPIALTQGDSRVAVSAGREDPARAAASQVPGSSPPLSHPVTSPAADAGATATDRPEPRFAQIDNSLRIAIVPEQNCPLVSVQVWYRVGAVDDEPNRPGLCHVARTLMEQRVSPTAVRSDARVHFETRTLHDACVFHWTGPATQLDSILSLEAARMKPRSIDSADVERACDTAATVLADPLEPEGFADHPYARAATRVAPSLRAAPPASIAAFTERWFVPGNAQLIIVGNVDAENAMASARAAFADVPWADVPRRAPVAALSVSTGEGESSRAPVAGVDLIWPCGAADAVENAATDVLMHRLTNTVDGPLARELLARGALPPRASRREWKHGGIVILAVDLPDASDARVGEVVDAARAAIAKAAEDLPDPIAFDRARALAARDRRMTFTDFRRWAIALGHAEVVSGDIERALMPSRQPITRAEDLRRAAQRLADGPLFFRRRVLSPVPTTQISRSNAFAPGVAPTTAPARRGSFRLWPGLGDLAIVRTALAGAHVDPRGVATAMAVGSERWTVEQYRDYLTYRGIDLTPFGNVEGGLPIAGLESRGPAKRLAAMLEMHRDLIDRPRAGVTVGPDVLAHLARQVECARLRLESRLYVPPGWIGWRVDMPLPPAGFDTQQVALRSLRASSSLRIEVAASGASTEEIVRLLAVLWPEVTFTSASSDVAPQE